MGLARRLFGPSRTSVNGAPETQVASRRNAPESWGAHDSPLRGGDPLLTCQRNRYRSRR